MTGLVARRAAASAGSGLFFVFFMAFLVSQRLVHGEEVESEKPVARGRVSDLLKNPHFLLFLLIGLSGGISFSTLNTYLFPYMKELGAGESVMGLALTIGTVVEMPVLFFVNSFVKRFRAYPLLIFSLAMTGLRFLLLGIAPNPTFVLFVQLLNGFNYPLLTVAAVTYADEQAPEGYHATTQGLFNAASGGIGGVVCRESSRLPGAAACRRAGRSGRSVWLPAEATARRRSFEAGTRSPGLLSPDVGAVEFRRRSTTLGLARN